jgi:hypothetical protein
MNDDTGQHPHIDPQQIGQEVMQVSVAMAHQQLAKLQTSDDAHRSDRHDQEAPGKTQAHSEPDKGKKSKVFEVVRDTGEGPDRPWPHGKNDACDDQQHCQRLAYPR